MALEEWGAAVASCTQGLRVLQQMRRDGGAGGAASLACAVDPELQCKLLVRRAKAHLKRYEHQVGSAGCLLGLGGWVMAGGLRVDLVKPSANHCNPHHRKNRLP